MQNIIIPDTLITLISIGVKINFKLYLSTFFELH